MFNIFGKKEKSSAKNFIDINFMSQQEKEYAVIKCATENRNAFFIAWFAETEMRFKKIFEVNVPDAARVINAKQFSAAKYPGQEFFFLEHFPLREKEEQLISNHTQQNFTVYNSLTEPFFSIFGGVKIIELTRKMGYKENEPMQHTMISSSIKRAQEKIAKSVTVEQPASSQKDWLLRNVAKD